MSTRNTSWLVSCALGLGLLWTSGVTSILAQTLAPLPTGNTGIASRYPGDAGIASDPGVIFADDFESYSNVTALTGRWNQVFQIANTRLATETANVYRGAKALEFTVPTTSSEVSNNAIKAVSPERDTLFLRYYGKYDAAFNVLGSSHNGSSISAHYCCPGVPADGSNKFFVSPEFWRDQSSAPNPGKLNVYVYHPEQRDQWGDHFYPNGVVSPFTNTPGNFGSDFVARPDFTPVLGQWYSYELMVKANTPGQRDGRIAIWVDGNLAADFPNLRLRDTTALKIDQFTIDLHVHGNTLGVAKKWFDNVVAATSYIGPVAGTSSPAPLPPTNVRIVR